MSELTILAVVVIILSVAVIINGLTIILHIRSHRRHDHGEGDHH